ncbi:hypothetical protein SAMN02745127_01181 [Oceanospirillum multiglobuliferum]|nr:hypothetical protein SAMN02745127_01181 [Oceanospirillum multiglobuliferum]
MSCLLLAALSFLMSEEMQRPINGAAFFLPLHSVQSQTAN